MSSSVGSISLDMGLNTAGYKKSLSGLEKSTKSTFGRVGDFIKGQLGADIIKSSAKAILGFATSAIKLGSNLSEVQNVVDTVFTSMAGSVNAYAKSAISSVGLSETIAKKYMGTFGAMSKSMGFTESEAFDMSKAMTDLSGDVASFYNLDSGEAYNKLKAVWTGETEGLKELGVVMTETNLNQFALSQGMKKTVGQMTEQEKVALRYKYVLNNLSAASGDFAKTQDSWANQTRVLSLRWDAFKATIGQGLINLLTPVLTVVNALIGKLQILGDKFAALTGAGKINTTDAEKQAKAAAITATEMQSSADSADNVASSTKAANKALQGFDVLNKAQDTSGAGGGGSSGASVSSGSSIGKAISTEVTVDTQPAESKLNAFSKFLKKKFAGDVSSAISKVMGPISELKGTFSGIFDDIQSLGAPFVSWLKTGFCDVISAAFDTVSTNISVVLTVLQAIIQTVWDAVFPILELFITEGLPRLSEFCEGVLGIISLINTEILKLFEEIWPSVDNFYQIVSTMWTDLMNIMFGAWDAHGKPIFDGLAEAVRVTSDLFLALWETTLKPIVNNLAELLDWLWDKHIKGFVSEVVDAVGSIIECLVQLYDKFLAPLVKAIVEYVGPQIAVAFNTIANVIGTVFGGIFDVVGGLIKILKGVIEFVTGVFTGDWGKAWQGVKDIFGGVWDSLVGIVKVPINLIIDLVNGLVNGVVAGFNLIIKALNKMSFTVPDWVPGIGGKDFGFNLSEVTAPKIPKLAQGAYVKANQPQLALIGDNKTQGEIVAPENKILEIVMAAFEKVLGQLGLSGQGGPGGDLSLVIKLGEDTLYDNIIKGINQLQRQRGTILLEV